MQSGEDPQISTLSHTNIIPDAPQRPESQIIYGNPKAQDILAKLKQSDNPLDFIKNNLKPREPVINPQAIADEIHAARPPFMPLEPIPTEPAVGPELPAVVSGTSDAALSEEKIETQPTDTSPIDAPLATDTPSSDVVKPKPTIEDNYKLLRTEHKQVKQTLDALQKERQDLADKLTKYETGAATPEAIAELQTRIKELEPFEAVVNAKRTPAYRTTIVEPLNALGAKLSEIGKEYDVPDEVLSEAVDITKNAELDNFLMNHFSTDLGALEAKQIIKDMQKIRVEAQKLETAPKEALARLQEEHQRLETERVQTRHNTIASRSKSAWERAVHGIREKGRVTELIPRANDQAFNERYVKPIMEKAATEYGRMVKALAEHGLEDLPDDLAEALANASLLSIASAVSIERANAAEEYAATLSASTNRTNGMIRPSIGSSSPNAGMSRGDAPKRPSSPLEAGAMILNKVLSGSR